MEFAQAGKGLGIKAITGAELTLTDGSHLTLLVESRDGYRNLCRLVTLAHADTRVDPRVPTPPRISLDQLEQHADGLVCLSGCARDGLLARRVETGVLHQAERLGRRLVAAFGAERFRIELQRPFWRRDGARNRALAQLAARLGVAAVATGNVHAHHSDRARLQDALVAVRLRSSLDETEPERRGNGSSVMAPPADDGRALSRPPRRGGRDGPPRGAAGVRSHARPRLPLSRLGGSRSRPQARRALPHADRHALPGRRRRGDRAPGPGAARDRRTGPLRLLPAPPRSARARPRGGRGGARSRLRADPAPARPRARLERQLDRLLPHRPLPHRPDREQALPRALPERGDHVAAGHRPRLPARHPREAAPARARTLWVRACGARGSVRHLPLARRDPRSRQGAGAAGRRDRAPRAIGGHIWRPGSLHARGHRGDRRTARRLVALAGADRARAGGLRASPACLAAPGRDGDLDRSPDRSLSRPAVGDGGTQPGPVGQGLVCGRRVSQDRPARAGNALGGRALRRRDRARARRADRPVADRLRRPGGLRRDPGRRHDRRVPDREPCADAEHQAHQAREPRRPHRPGRARAAGADPGRRRAPIYRAARAAPRRPRATASPMCTRRSSRCWRRRSA